MSAELPIIDNPPAVNRDPDGRFDPSEPLLPILLAEQRELTAVERFSAQHQQGLIPNQAQRYSHLLPATGPAAGQQYAFDVDLDRCSGCKACVAACHSLNGLDTEETWRDVGLLVGGTSSNPVMQHVTTACHHCVEPACMTACPVDAYEKDPVTGIVKHLDDQCFGCQYCTLACPYDVPKYHSQKGIVRKCDMCSDRLAEGEAPACVQACPHEAIAISVVEINQVTEDAEANLFLPAAPDPQLTLPTTTYRTRRAFPRNMLPADYESVRSQHPHWPLIIMLVLTQLSVGAFVTGTCLGAMLGTGRLSEFRPLHASNALLFGLLALSASVFHLGRPRYAFRAIIGLRHSWLSREIVCFGGFAGLATLHAGAAWMDRVPTSVHWGLAWSVAVTGIAGVFCSGMIYVFTRREFWTFERTMTRFFLTSVVLGIAATWLTILLLGPIAGRESAQRLATELSPLLARGLIVATGLKLLFELALLRHLFERRRTPLKRSAQLSIGPLSNALLARVATGVLGGIVMPVFLLSTGSSSLRIESEVFFTVVLCFLFLACLAGELLERYLFFAAVASPRMPGNLRT